MDQTNNGLKLLFSRLKEVAKKVGLWIKEDKPDYMVMGRRHSTEMFPSLKVDDYEFNRAKQFKYLGSILTEKNEIDNEIASRILSGNKCFYGLAKILGSWSFSREMKKHLYILLVLPVIT